MNVENARRHIIDAIQEASGVLNDSRFVRIHTDPGYDVSFEAIDLDSLGTMDVCVLLEERLGVEVDLGDLVEHASINRLARVLAERCTRL